MSLIPRFSLWMKDWLLAAKVSVSDIRYEWVQSLCIALALGAIFAPLFILLGLKEGIIGTMLDRLRSDPESTVVTPNAPVSPPLDETWMKQLADRASYVIASPTAYLMLDVPNINEQVNAFPTDEDDPLLVENGISFVKSMQEIVLSERLSRMSGAKVGDAFALNFIRNTGKEEEHTFKFTVIGILPQQSQAVNKVWIHKTLFSKLYAWRKGQALPELGLTGVNSTLPSEYDGIVILSDTLPTQSQYHQILAGRASFSRTPEPLRVAGWTLPAGKKAVLWRAVGNRVFDINITTLRNQYLNLGIAVEAVPHVDSFQVTLEGFNRDMPFEISILPESAQPDEAFKMGQKESILWVNPKYFDGRSDCAVTHVNLKSRNNFEQSRIPAIVCPSFVMKLGYVAIPGRLAGQMRAAQQENAVYRPETESFDIIDQDTRYFRAYAPSLDGLEELVEFIQKSGEIQARHALRDPISKIAEVRKILRLSQYMEQLYVLIVLVSGISCFFAIVANVHAGIQRKRRDLAMLQLFGLRIAAIFFCPILKSVTLVVGGVIISLVAYKIFETIGSHLLVEGSESISRLSLQHTLMLLCGILFVTSMASFVAAATVFRIDPGEFIRE